MNIGVIFPHQLFEQNVLISTCETIYLVEGNTENIKITNPDDLKYAEIYL